MSRFLIAVLLASFAVSACGPKPDRPSKDTLAPDTQINGLLTPQDSKNDEPPVRLETLDLSPTFLASKLRSEFELRADTRSMLEIRENGILPEAKKRMDQCVDTMLFTGAVETACFGRIVSACPGLEGSTADMVGCNALEYDYWEGRLKAAYDRLIVLLKAEDKDMVGEGIFDISLADEVKNGQETWLAFRDAQCGYANNQFRGGTMGRITGSACMWEQTARRSIELEVMASNHEPQ